MIIKKNYFLQNLLKKIWKFKSQILYILCDHNYYKFVLKYILLNKVKNKEGLLAQQKEEWIVKL